MNACDVVCLVSRLLHIGSAVTLLGALLFARFALVPAGQSALVARYSTALRIAVAGLLASGLYNLLMRPAVPPGYHAVFGVKFLLALHVFAVAFLLGNTAGGEEKRARRLTGAVITGVAILALSAYLRALSL